MFCRVSNTISHFWQPELKTAEALEKDVESVCCLCGTPWNKYRGQFKCPEPLCKVPYCVCVSVCVYVCVCVCVHRYRCSYPYMRALHLCLI